MPEKIISILLVSLTFIIAVMFVKLFLRKSFNCPSCKKKTRLVGSTAKCPHCKVNLIKYPNGKYHLAKTVNCPACESEIRPVGEKVKCNNCKAKLVKHANGKYILRN